MLKNIYKSIYYEINIKDLKNEIKQLGYKIL